MDMIYSSKFPLTDLESTQVIFLFLKVEISNLDTLSNIMNDFFPA